MSNVQTVHVVFKTHLDSGSTALAHNVVCQFHERCIPQALATAEALRSAVPSAWSGRRARR